MKQGDAICLLVQANKPKEDINPWKGQGLPDLAIEISLHIVWGVLCSLISRT